MAEQPTCGGCKWWEKYATAYGQTVGICGNDHPNSGDPTWHPEETRLMTSTETCGEHAPKPEAKEAVE